MPVGLKGILLFGIPVLVGIKLLSSFNLLWPSWASQHISWSMILHICLSHQSKYLPSYLVRPHRMTTPAAVETEAQIFRRIPKVRKTKHEALRVTMWDRLFKCVWYCTKPQSSWKRREECWRISTYKSLARTLAALEAGKCLHSRWGQQGEGHQNEYWHNQPTVPAPLLDSYVIKSSSKWYHAGLNMPNPRNSPKMGGDRNAGRYEFIRMTRVDLRMA